MILLYLKPSHIHGINGLEKKKGKKEKIWYLFLKINMNFIKILYNIIKIIKKDIPKILNEETTREMIYKFFDDCADPLPDYNDIIKLAGGAIRKDEEINHFTFKEKEKVDPATLARKYKELNFLELKNKLKEIYDNNKLCRIIYKDIFENFVTDVMQEITKILTGTEGPDKEPDKSEEDKIIELPVLPQYPEGEGYNLEEIMESVIYRDKNSLNKTHFPKW